MAEEVEVKSVLPAGKSEAEAIAELRLSPFMRNATIANAMASNTIKFAKDSDPVEHATARLMVMAEHVASGDLKHVSDTLLSQAVMLDANVTELMRRAWANAGEYPEAFRSYMTLALKAQGNCRATLDILARLHQPREQVVRHVHVHEGGQAVVADQFHHHAAALATGGQNAGNTDQSLATSASLPGPDPSRNGVPVPGSAGEKAVSHARRDKPRRTAGQQKRAEARPQDC